MADLDAQFTAAAEAVKKFTKDPGNDAKLCIYALFKQANVGDCNTSRPGMLDMAGRAKWDAWNKLKGKSQEDAKKEYVAKVEELKATCS